MRPSRERRSRYLRLAGPLFCILMPLLYPCGFCQAEQQGVVGRLSLDPLLWTCPPSIGQSKLLFPDTCGGAYAFRPLREDEEAQVRARFAQLSRNIGAPRHQTRSVQVRLRCAPKLQLLSTHLLGNDGSYPATAFVSSGSPTIFLVENSLESEFFSSLMLLSHPPSEPDAAISLTLRQFRRFVGINPRDANSVERFRQAYFGVAGETQGRLTSILLEEMLHIEDCADRSLTPTQLETRAMLFRLLKGIPLLELSQALSVGQSLRTNPMNTRERWDADRYSGWAHISLFILSNVSVPLPSVTETEIRCLTEQYLFEHYPEDAERLLNHPGVARYPRYPISLASPTDVVSRATAVSNR